ncbi:hypothetical protein [Moraxella lacunata]
MAKLDNRAVILSVLACFYHFYQNFCHFTKIIGQIKCRQSPTFKRF